MTRECRWSNLCPQPAAVESPADFRLYHDKVARGYLHSVCLQPSTEARALIKEHYLEDEDG